MKNPQPDLSSTPTCRQWLLGLVAVGLLWIAGAPQAQAQACSGCDGVMVNLGRDFSIWGLGTLKITIGDDVQSFPSTVPWQMPWPSDPETQLPYRPEIKPVFATMGPDGFVEVKAEIVPALNAAGDPEHFQVATGCTTCNLGGGIVISSHHWACVMSGTPPQCETLLYPYAPTHYEQTFRVRVREDSDPANDPGETSEPGPQSNQPSPPPDEMPELLKKVSQVASLGRTGTSPLGRLRFSADVTAGAVTRSDFALQAVTAFAGLVTTVPDSINPALPKQFKSPEALFTLTDISAGSSTGVRLEYFTAVGATANPDGSFTPAGSAKAVIEYVPVTTTIGSSSISGVKITETRDGKVDFYEYYAEAAASGQGGVRREIHNGRTTTIQESPLLAPDGVTLTGRLVETTSYDGGSSPSHQIEEFQVFSWGQELVERVEDPSGAARTTTYEYYDGVPSTSPYYGRLHLEHSSDGSWHRNIYDPVTGRLRAVYKPWVNSPTSLSAIRALGENDCHANVYVEEMIFESDVPRRTVIEKILGTVVKSTVTTTTVGMDYVTGFQVDASLTETRLKDGTVADRLRSGYTGGNRFSAGKLLYSVNDESLFTHYEHEENLPPGPGETLARRQSIVTRGTLDHPDGVARQQTRTVTISNSEGLIERRTEVALGAGGFAILEKQTVERQLAAPQETQKLDGVIVSTRTQVSSYVEETTDEVGLVTSTEVFPSGEPKTVIRNGVRTEYYYSAGSQAVYRHAGSSRPASAPTDSELSYTDGLGRIYQSIAKGSSKISQFAHVETLTGRQETEKDLFSNEISTTTYYANGSLASVEGPSVVSEYHTYGVDATTGNRWERVSYGTPLSPRWRTTVSDGAGRVIREVQPAPHGLGLMTTSHFYNNRGQRVRTVKTGAAAAATLYEYDSLGQLFRQGVDINGNGVLDVHSNEPITERLGGYEQANGYWWQVNRQRVYFEDGGARFHETESRRRLGAGPNERQESIVNGIKTTIQVVVNRGAKTRTTTTSRSDSTNVGVRLETNGLITWETTIDQPSPPTLYYYDGLERVSRVRPKSWSGYVEYGYDEADRVVSELNVPVTPGSGATGHIVNNAYHYFSGYDGWRGGLLKYKVSSKGANMVPVETWYAYNERGQVTHQWGDADYPLAYVYDGYGQMVELKTYRTANAALWLGSGSGTPPSAFATEAASAGTTAWHYETATGLLLEKEDSAGQSTNYAYGLSGNLVQRTWARGVTTSYAYSILGRLTSQSYSDGTPPVSFGYHRNGALKSVMDASGTRTLDLDPSNGKLSRESTVNTPSGGDLLSGLVLERSYDTFARPVSIAVVNASSVLGPVGPLVPSIATTYEATQGKVGSMGSGDLVATYQYQNASSNLDQRVITRSSMTTTDDRDVIMGPMASRSMNNRWRRSKYLNLAAPGTLSVRGNDDSTILWNYGFNARNEVISAERNQSGAPAAPYSPVSNTATSPGNLLAGWASTFSYDEIGNRTQATYGYDGAEAGTVDYTTNALNQYSSLGNSADLFVLGLASASSAVKVNGVDTITRTSSSPWGPTPEDYGLPFRQGDYFSARLQADNASGPDWVAVAVQASTVTQAGHVYHPPATETLTYDLDGNLTADGRWTYAWDGENRLISMTTTAAAVLAGVPDLRLTFAYDAQSRRIRKVVEHAVGVGSWQLDSDTRFIYDGWNLLAEVEMHNSSVSGRAKDAPAGVEGPYVRRSYLWGPDVSGTMQGAGGVGGLLAVRRHARGTKGPLSMWTAWDLNGNIIGLHQNTSRSALTANYEYDPFGKPLRVSEPEEDLNPFRFSTKYTDAETGLCYYGYRYYDAVRGRWINRDPIEEQDSINLYGTLDGNMVQNIDVLGLMRLKEGRDALSMDLEEAMPAVRVDQANPSITYFYFDGRSDYGGNFPVTVTVVSDCKSEPEVNKVRVGGFQIGIVEDVDAVITDVVTQEYLEQGISPFPKGTKTSVHRFRMTVDVVIRMSLAFGSDLQGTFGFTVNEKSYSFEKVMSVSCCRGETIAR